MIKKIILFIFTLVIFSCKKDPKTIEKSNGTNNNPFEVTGSVYFSFTNVVGNQLLSLNIQDYYNSNKDTFKITTFKYYVSNIKLTRSDGFIYSEPESYHLINQADTDGTGKFIIQNIPHGNYTSIQFIIGVDSLRNCDGAQTGALDVTNDMFWSWSQGYIFAKLEGTFKHGFIPKNFANHIGGFSFPTNNIKVVSPAFNGNILQVDNDHQSKVLYKADLNEWFKMPAGSDFSWFVIYRSIAGGPQMKVIADNYATMFSVAAINH